MKRIIYLFFFASLLFPSLCISTDDEPTICQVTFNQFMPEPIPNYLQPWWSNVRIGKFAVVYVDFPDGRYINGNDTLQPFYDWQLEWVYSHGVLDAAGEMGLVLEPTNIPAGNKFVKASKYTYYDRWNMFFDSLGVYYGTAHPDWASNGDSAWGSMKQYWKEASNGKFELIPYITHPNETDYKLKTGIVNNYEMVNGVPVIKCLKLPKKKYGTLPTNSYFRNDTDFVDMSVEMINDTKREIRNQTNFNLTQFLSEGGKLFIYFAGYHRSFKDASWDDNLSPIRSRENRIDNPESRIDGFGVTAHQYGHMEFLWYHTNSGRCDIMNGGDVHDNNCPQLPNPVFRMQQGWLQPIRMDSVQQILNLPPVETSYKVGVVTIYGKPSVAPDWSSGESFVVENRRRLGFDRKLLDLQTSLSYPDFKGGLLVWHFSPYNKFPDPYNIDVNYVKFITADTTKFLAQNRGNPKSFFAYAPFPITLDPRYYKLDSAKTYSAENLKTGIELRNIEQADYSNLNSNINFDLKYLIAPPRHYSDVIYYRQNNNHFINYSDTIFYHGADLDGFFNIQPGTIVENAGGPYAGIMYFNTMKAKGSVANPITFRGVGYTSDKTTYSQIRFTNTLESYSAIDSLILSNINFENILPQTNLRVGNNEFNPIPVSLENITFPQGNNGDEIYVINSTIARINLSNRKIRLSRIVDFLGSVVLSNSRMVFINGSYSFKGPNSFLNVKANSNIELEDTMSLEFKNGGYIRAFNSTFSSTYVDKRWKGLKLINSGVDSIIGCSFTNARTPISITNSQNSSFKNRVIKNNTFNIPSGANSQGIYGEDNYYILIQNNTFNMPVTNGLPPPFYSGIFLKCSDASGENVSSGGEGEEEMETTYSLNIVSNVFNNGSASVVLDNYTSNYLPYYLRANTFNAPALLGIYGMKITGTIKDNVTTSLSNKMGIHLVNSSPNLYNNSIGSNNVTLNLTGNCYPNLAPYTYNNNLIWTGGKNRLTSYLSDNIQLTASGNVYTDFGENRFSLVNTTTLVYHIYGWVDSTIYKYYSRNNCWYSNNENTAVSKIYLRRNHTTEPIPTVTGNTTVDCSVEIDPNGWEVDYLGNSIYDSIKLSEDNTGDIQSEDEMLYNQAEHFTGESMFADAITAYKDLINNYPAYAELPKSMLNLYSCYEYLDTGSTQSYRNTLFGNLKNYAEEKLDTLVYKNEEFLTNAYDVMLMCEAKIENYDEAMNGYEFIALFHPDPDMRLVASWNYAEIEALINSGNGGGEKQLLIKNEELDNNEIIFLKEQKELERFNEIINDDPVMRKLKKSFENANTERKIRIEKIFQTPEQYHIESKNFLKKSNELDKLKENKARRNLFELKNLSKEELENRRLEDLLLSIKDFKNEVLKTNTVTLPTEFKLEQNYPNPFNPKTVIRYSLLAAREVSLKVYDVLGNEAATLVNENKNAGSYEVEFDGSNFSSGIYFYIISAGDFSDTKKMTLIK